MDKQQKRIQNFILAPNHAVKAILDLLKMDIAHKIGITRNFSVKIVDFERKNTKLIPIQINNIDTLKEDLKILNQEIQIELKTISKHWNDDWALTRTQTDLHKNLLTKLPLEIMQHIPKTFDTIGNLAIIEIDRWGELSEYIYSTSELQRIVSLVGDTIIGLHKNITTVLRKAGNIDGEFRLRSYEVVSGPSHTSTLHKENNCAFNVDPTKMFFSPRLSYERKRVATLNFKKNSIILDCFAGCGPYSIQIASNHDVRTFGIEKNPNAYEYFKRNIKLNKKHLKGTVIPFLGDFRKFHESDDAESCLNKVDWIIMNLPERSHEFIPEIIPFVKDDCTNLVFYSFLKSSNPLQDAESNLRDILQKNNLSLIDITQKRIVFSYSPNQNNVGIDVKIKRQ